MEYGFAARFRQAELAGEQVVLFAALAPFNLTLPEIFNLSLELFEPIAAVFGDGLPDFVAALVVFAMLFLEMFDAGLQAFEMPGELVEADRQELALELCEPGRERVAAAALLGDLGGQLGVLFGIGHQRFERADLFFGFQDGLVRPVEIVEVSDQGIDVRVDREPLQHVLAHEAGHVADRFHRHGLVE